MTDSAKNEPAATGRLGTTLAIVWLVASACGIAAACEHVSAREELRKQTEFAYIEANNCVVAQMDGRIVGKYRCTTPSARYLTPMELAREASKDQSVRR